jgi:Pyridoxal phosphate biosynthesis protein
MYKKVLAITMGDPAGVGAEVIAKAIRRLNLPNVRLLLIGDSWVFTKFIKHLPKNCDFLDLNNVSKKSFKFGKITRANGKAAVDYLNLAVSLIKKREIGALVTAPISKEAVSSAGFKFPGHTEFLAGSFNVKNFVMMFVAGNLRVSLVTRHIPLKDVASKLHQKNIYENDLHKRGIFK